MVDDFFPSLQACSTKPLKIIGFYLFIYIEHKGAIGLGSNEFIKAKEKIES